MRAGLRGSVGTGTKGDESITALVWVAGLHHIRARFRFARAFKITIRLFIQFPPPFFFFCLRHGKPRIGGPPVLDICTGETPLVPAVCRTGQCWTYLGTTGELHLYFLGGRGVDNFLPQWEDRIFLPSVTVEVFKVDRKSSLFPGLCFLLYPLAISPSQQKPASNLLI
jgi:hypothetical protein